VRRSFDQWVKELFVKPLCPRLTALAGFIQDGLRVICCDGAPIIVEIGPRWAEHGMMPPAGKQKVTSGLSVRCVDMYVYAGPGLTVASKERADRGRRQSPGETLSSAHANPLVNPAKLRVKSWLAKLSRSSAGQLTENLVEGRPVNSSGDRTPLLESPRGCSPAPQCRPVAQSNAQDRIVKTVDRIDSRNRGRRAVYPDVHSNQGVAIAIDLFELIETR
jgi:hypothetical protein